MKSILDCVLAHPKERPCVTWVSRGSTEVTRTFGDVVDGSARAAAGYASMGVGTGDTVVLVGTHHPDLYAAWLGAVWVGAVPTVLAEPSVRIDKGLYWSRLGEQIKRIDAKLLVTDPNVEIDSRWPVSMQHVTYEALAESRGEPPSRPAPSEEQLLLLQHSSGTTGLHKGVMLSHGAVMRHADAYLPQLTLTAEDVVASWLPLYHDMGLIACFVCPLIAGVHVVWLSPFEWVASPSLLLKAVQKHRATLAWLPNFAYAFLAQRVRDSSALSSLRMVINCSEPVTAEAMRAFADRFVRDGFAAGALHTCYAMAENVFAVTATTSSDPPRYFQLDEQAWRDEHCARPAKPGARAVTHVSNGRAIPGCEVKVADSEGARLPAGSAGRLLIRSPFLLSGYFRRDDLNASLLDRDGFYDTGDLGWVDTEGHVYVTGRVKDLIIVGGRNVYPQDIEQVANETKGVHPGRAVSFGVGVRSLGTEGAVVLVESDEPEAEWPEVARTVRAAVPARLDLDLADVRVVASGALRKSTSGKLARGGNREWYLEGRFGPVPAHLKAREGT
jgi:acyl-CoA synthetase (AMP-forming)/AMP-acid ligase II